MPRRLLAALGLTAACLAGCDSVVEPGAGTLGGSGSAPVTTESTKPTGSTEPTETSTESSQSTASTATTTGGQPTESSDPEQLAAAEAVGAAFERAVNVGTLDVAYGLLCSADQAEVTVEDFSSDAPGPGSFSLAIVEEVGSGVFRAEATFDGDTGEVFVRPEDGSYCLSQEA